MAKFKSYADCLKQVKALNPELEHKQALKLASELWKKQKEAAVKLTEKPEETKSVTKSGSASPHLAGITGAIQQNASTINEVQIALANANIHHYEIVEDGKDGANTKIYIKLTGGDRIPASGHFTVFK